VERLADRLAARLVAGNRWSAPAHFCNRKRPRVGVSSAGATVSVVKSSADLYLLPLDSRSGQAAGVTRRLTHDGRYKVMAHVGGEPRMAYSYTWDFSGPKLPRNVYALDLDT
jgi:hypothetical protein